MKLPIKKRGCLFCLFVLYAGTLMGSESEIKSRIIVVDGQDVAARYQQQKWLPGPTGGIVGTGEEQVLYADGFVGAGDFHLKAKLVLHEEQRDNAAFVLNESNFLFFFRARRKDLHKRTPDRVQTIGGRYWGSGGDGRPFFIRVRPPGIPDVDEN